MSGAVAHRILGAWGHWPMASTDGSSSLHVPSAQLDADGTFVERMNDQAAFPPPSCLLLPVASTQ